MSRSTPAKSVRPRRAAAQSDFGGLDVLLGYQLRRAQGAMHRDFLRAVAGMELTQKQAATLWLIDANPGISQVDVGASLGMDRATTMTLVDRLQERKLIQRRRSQVDRRRQELMMTSAGVAFLAKVKSRIRKHELKVSNLFKAKELKALFAFLQKLQQLE